LLDAHSNIKQYERQSGRLLDWIIYHGDISFSGARYSVHVIRVSNKVRKYLSIRKVLEKVLIN
jgi:hypothetical protein